MKLYPVKKIEQYPNGPRGIAVLHSFGFPGKGIPSGHVLPDTPLLLQMGKNRTDFLLLAWMEPLQLPVIDTVSATDFAAV